MIEGWRDVFSYSMSECGGSITSHKKASSSSKKRSLNEELGAPLMHDCFLYVHFSADLCTPAPLLNALKKT